VLQLPVTEATEHFANPIPERELERLPVNG
jgi:hypothetical protein